MPMIMPIMKRTTKIIRKLRNFRKSLENEET